MAMWKVDMTVAKPLSSTGQPAEEVIMYKEKNTAKSCMEWARVEVVDIFGDLSGGVSIFIEEQPAV